jgi:hypothetical protein
MHIHQQHLEIRKGSEIQDLLARIAHAITRGDGKTVAELWDVPATIISDDGVMVISHLDQLEPMFSSVKSQYEARGVVETRGDIHRLTRISERLFVVEIRWPQFDAKGREVGAETSDYTLRRDDAGKLRIRSVLMRGVERGRH